MVEGIFCLSIFGNLMLIAMCYKFYSKYKMASIELKHCLLDVKLKEDKATLWEEIAKECVEESKKDENIVSLTPDPIIDYK